MINSLSVVSKAIKQQIDELINEYRNIDYSPVFTCRQCIAGVHAVTELPLLDLPDNFEAIVRQHGHTEGYCPKCNTQSNMREYFEMPSGLREREIDELKQKIEEKSGMTQIINNMQGATIHGSVTVAKKIQGSFNTLKGADLDDELKNLMSELLTQIAELSKSNDGDSVQHMVDESERLSQEIAKDKPSKKYWGLNLEGIQEAATAVGKTAKPILETTTKILSLLAKIFPT